MGHSDVLRQLQPGLVIKGVYDGDFDVEALCLDRLKANADDLALEMFPDTATDTIADWEARFGIVPASTDSLSARQAAIVAKERSRRIHRKDEFYSIADALGWNIYVDGTTPVPWIQIIDGQFLPFVCGYSIVGRDILYDGLSGHSQYTVTVRGSFVSGQSGSPFDIARALRLQSLFMAAHCQGTEFVFTDV